MAQFRGKRCSRRWKLVLTAAEKAGVRFVLTSGRRTLAEQAALFRQNMVLVQRFPPRWAPRPGRPLTAFPSPNAPHIRVGRQNHAIDVNALDGGETRLQRWLERQGVTVTNPVPGEAWHMDIPRGLRRLSRRIRRGKHKPPPVPHPAKGIDVSSHQGRVDFATARRAGYQFVWIKASEGQDWTDPLFLHNVRAAKAAGLKVGAYTFLRPRAGRTGAVEARFLHQQLQVAGLGRGDLRPVLDVETTALGREETRRYTREAIVELARLTGIKPLFYTYSSFNGGSWPADFPDIADLWIAAYEVAAPKIPSPWRTFAAWQFTSSGAVPGIQGRCDLNTTPDLRCLIAS